VLLAADAPISGGLVLRALAAGTPLVTAAEGRASRVVSDWLERDGLAPAANGADTRARLAEALERGPAVVEAVARGRVRAQERSAAFLAARLSAALDSGAAARRRAA
jgi:hypothetical protein